MNIYRSGTVKRYLVVTWLCAWPTTLLPSPRTFVVVVVVVVVDDDDRFYIALLLLLIAFM